MVGYVMSPPFLHCYDGLWERQSRGQELASVRNKLGQRINKIILHGGEKQVITRS